MKKWHQLLMSMAMLWTLTLLAMWPGGGCAVDTNPPADGAPITLPDGKVVTPPNTTPDKPGTIPPPVIADGGDPKPSKEVPCPPTQEAFKEKLWEPMLSTQCLSCHHSEGPAKKSRFILHFPSEKDALVNNLKSAMTTAAIIENGTSILLAMPTGTGAKPHPGGSLISQGSEIYNNLKAFIDAATGVTKDCNDPGKPGTTTSCEDQPPGPQMLRRLTRVEYDNTITDLFGITSKWGIGFVADNVIEGFDNNATALTVTPLLADQIRIAAEEIAAEAIKNMGKLLPCDPKAADRNCAINWIKSFGMKVYREPLTQGQVDELAKLFDLGSKQSYERGIELTITGMLQSPFFLYRRELGEQQADGTFKLTHYEIASALSYLFWGTMPDDTLFAAAKAGKLQDPKEIAKQAERLLASSRSRFVYDQFFTQWLMVQRISSVPKDATIFAAFTPAIRKAMADELKRFVWYVMEQKSGTLTELLTSQEGVLNKELAAFYGVSAPTKTDSSGFGPIQFQDGNRGGLLTLGSVLSVHGRPDSSSPIHRGVLVRERLLCQHLPPPPAGVDAEPPGLDPNKTTRDRYTQHSADPTCKGCHSLIDPIGFGFEQFDGIGRFRTKEGGTTIDVRGEILNAPNTSGTFDGLKDLSAKLSKSTDVHQCFTLQWMRWSYGMKAKTPLKCALKKLSEDFTASGTDVKALLIAITQTKHFRMRLPADGAPASNPGNPNEPPPSSEPVAGADGGTSSPPDQPTKPPPTPANLDVKVTTQSKWNTGYCNQIVVTNKDTTDVTWTIQLDVQGTIDQLWNAVNTPASGGKQSFSGVAWNATLKPNQSANFGFCAKL